MKIGDVSTRGQDQGYFLYRRRACRFRELIKVFAERFHPHRNEADRRTQEAGRMWAGCLRARAVLRIVDIDFSGVTTVPYRDFAQSQKLAGQCSKLKCCMMYEYDTYVDARKVPAPA